MKPAVKKKVNKCKCKQPSLYNPYAEITHCIKCGGTIMRVTK